MKTVIGALVGLVIGAGGTYLFEQGKVTNLQTNLSALETQLSEAKSTAESSASEFAKLQDAGKSKADAAVADLTKSLEAKTQEVSSLQAKVTELEAAVAAAKSGTAQ